VTTRDSDALRSAGPLTRLGLGRVTRAAAEQLGDALQELRARPKMAQLKLDPEQRQILDQLNRHGVVAVEGYWPRERALALRDALADYAALGEDRDFDGGAYLRCWNHDRPKLPEMPQEDLGITRLYHLDKLLPELAEFRFEPFVLNLASAYYRVPMYSGMLQFQYNRADTNETRYYHVDAFHKEFKAFLYLDDVEVYNGPFMYLKGSHRAGFVRWKKQLLGNSRGALTSFYPCDLKGLLDREQSIVGPAGTLILADVRGLHRGGPQQAASRSVLVNYIYKHPHEYRPDR